MKKKIGKRGSKSGGGMMALFGDIDRESLTEGLRLVSALLRAATFLEIYKAQFGRPLLKSVEIRDKKTR